MKPPSVRSIPKLPTIQRFPIYLTVLRSFLTKGREFISTTHLAEALHLPAIVIRKDLQMTGITGTPRVGFDLRYLISSIEEFLGWNNTTDAFLVGVRGFGQALMAYEGFAGHGMQIIAGFDRQTAGLGKELFGKPILPLKKLPDLCERMHVALAILTVPDSEAQETGDLLVEAGIQAIWDFTSARIQVPKSVLLQKAGLVSELAVLSRSLRDQRMENWQPKGA